MNGPPLPWAVSVNACVPAESPVTVWAPLGAELLSPGPLTETDDALFVVQLIVLEAGSVPVVGLAVIAPVTVGAEVTVMVTVSVAGPPGPCAVTV